MTKQTIILIVESSTIISSGLPVLIKSIGGRIPVILSCTDVEEAVNTLSLQRPKILIANPTILPFDRIEELKKEYQLDSLRTVALNIQQLDPMLTERFDEVINLYDDESRIEKKLESVIAYEPEKEVEDEEQSLTPREKEIVIGVVKGMTNKEIAQHLFLSTHTVITHRRNIAKKLQVHSPSGLTIYAIVNKLIKLEDIEKLAEGDAQK